MTFLTAEYGKLKGVARGVRRIGSRMAGHLELFSLSSLMLAKGKSLDVITSVNMQWHPKDLTDHYDKLRLAYSWAEMLDKLTDENHANLELYQLSVECFKSLEGAKSLQAIDTYFRLNLLSSLGSRPELEVCAVCHQTLGQELYFDCSHGGLCHPHCTLSREYKIAPNEAHTWLVYLSQDKLRIRKLTSTEVSTTGSRALSEFYRYTFGREFKAAKLLEVLG